MSLIIGLNLLRKVFLVSDTRITSRGANGLFKVEDDFIKSITLNGHVSSIAAGTASLAAHVLRNLKQTLGPNGYYSDLEKMIHHNLNELIIEYVNNSGRENEEAVIIFAGYNRSAGKVVDSASVGKVMSAPVLAQKRRIIHQSIDKELIQAILKLTIRPRGVESHTKLHVDVPSSNMMAIKINTNRASTERYSVDPIECYQYAVFAPPTKLKKIDIPIETIGNLETRDIRGLTTEQILYDDSEILMNFLLQTSSQHGFTTVGGNVFTQLVTEAGTIFPTGTLATNDSGKINIVGKIFVKDNKIGFTTKDGQERFFRTLEEYDATAGLELI